MDRKFYELCMQTTLSAGRDPVVEMVQRAEDLGFSGVAITDYVAEKHDVGDITDAVADISTNMDVRVGAKLRPDDGDALKRQVQQIRDEVDVLVVHGGDVSVNRAACGDTRVDVLAHPELGRKDSGLDHVMAKQAAENRVAVQLNVRQLLETRGKVRSHVLSHMRRNIRLCKKFGAPIITSSGAQNIHQLRGPRDLASIPRILGMDLKPGFRTVSEIPKQILDRADRVTSEETVQPGVRKVDEEVEQDE